MNCIFCKIVSGEYPSAKVYEDDKVLAFKDVVPQAPTHILIVPKEHILDGADEITEQNSAIVAHIFAVAAKIAKELDLNEGYRIVTNVGLHAGQTVRHIHFHLLGGKNLGTFA